MGASSKILVPEARLHSEEALKQRLLNGMGEFLPELRKVWGDSFESLFRLLMYATAPASQGLGLLQRDLANNAKARTFVLAGEFSAGTNPDGSDSPIVMGAVATAELLARMSGWRVPDEMPRNFRQESGAYSFLFSGGIDKREQFGEFSASVLKAQFDGLTRNRFASVSRAEEWSNNTAVQACLLAGYLFGVGADQLVITLPIENCVRFALTVAYALFHFFRKMCRTYFVSPGCEWSDRDPYKLELTRAQLAFDKAKKDPKNSKAYGGECSEERLWREQNSLLNGGFACPALSPAEFLTHFLPPNPFGS